MSKVQFMALVDEHQLDRIDALRIVMGVSRAEVLRQAIDDASGPLPILEQRYAPRLLRLRRLAAREGTGGWELWVRETVKGRMTLPPLETMEALAAEADGEPTPAGRTEPLNW